MAQYIDLISATKSRGSFELKTEATPYRYQHLQQTTGTFRLTITAAGDNCDPVTTQIIFEWNGIWDQIKAVPNNRPSPSA